MICTRTFLSGSLPGSFTTAPEMEDDLAGGVWALAGSRTARMMAIKKSGRVIGGEVNRRSKSNINCHPERSEGPAFFRCEKQILRFAQDDKHKLRTRTSNAKIQFKKYCRYSVSLCAGRNPASRMMRRNSSSVVQLVTPAARTTFSSSMTDPTSLPPKRKPIWQTFNPCVTQLDWTFTKFERYKREIASTFRYSTAVASSQWRPPSAVCCG